MQAHICRAERSETVSRSPYLDDCLRTLLFLVVTYTVYSCCEVLGSLHSRRLYQSIGFALCSGGIQYLERHCVIGGADAVFEESTDSKEGKSCADCRFCMR